MGDDALLTDGCGPAGTLYHRDRGRRAVVFKTFVNRRRRRGETNNQVKN